MGLKEQIISNGFIEVRLRVGGILQRHKFTVAYDQTPTGRVRYLVSNANIPAAQLANLANEYQLPFRSPLGTAFPPGKASKDFVVQESGV